jgi:hypothetical protein
MHDIAAYDSYSTKGGTNVQSKRADIRIIANETLSVTEHPHPQNIPSTSNAVMVNGSDRAAKFMIGVTGQPFCSITATKKR